jgi:glycolate oxidase FAD binding subunit
VVQFDSTDVKPILEMRSRLSSQGGFLTILEAPIALKQQLDVWGYTGNALDLMRKIKTQFDPENILSPGRFVGGI